jgi:hypothetical protein
MLNPENISPVEPDATQSGHFRSSDKTAKPEMFMPHPHRDLSVTRHREATEEEIWQVGLDVAIAQGKTLYGRCDISTSKCPQSTLHVAAKPLPGNPNHADIEGWPAEKPAQKLIALELAACASNLKEPPSIVKSIDA